MGEEFWWQELQSAPDVNKLWLQMLLR
jgi:hypothetical protein